MISKKVEEVIQSVNSLRPMPANITRLLKEIDGPNVSISTLAGLISLDQALTSLVLQMSNSASLG
jgi:HD-like signal output (HDOD) protein